MLQKAKKKRRSRLLEGNQISMKRNPAPTINLYLATHPTMFLPVFALMLCRAVFDKFTLRTYQPGKSLRRVTHRHAIHRGLRSIRAWCVDDSRVKTCRTVNPVTHLLRPNTPAFSLSTPFDCEDGGRVHASPREADHLALVVTAWVRAARGEVKVDLLRWDEAWMGEEDLREGRGLVREENDEWRALVVDYCAEGKINLWEAGGTPLSAEGVGYAHI